MAWTAHSEITIDHRQAANSDDYPVFTSLGDGTTKPVSGGGLLTNANGYDLGYAADPSGATTLYPYQRTKYDASTGLWEGFVKWPKVSGDFDITTALLIGNPAITTDQSSTSTWDANFQAVYHLNGSPLNVSDGTSNGFDGTNHGATAAASLFGNGGSAEFDGVADYVDLGTGPTAAIGTGPYTLEAWVEILSLPSAGTFPSIVNCLQVGLTDGVSLEINGSSGKFAIGQINSGFITAVVAGPVLVPNQTYYVVGTWNGSTLALYVDGVLVGSTFASSGHSAGFNMVLGRRLTTYLHAKLQEVRISNVARSQTYITNFYNNIRKFNQVKWSSQLAENYIANGAVPAPPDPPAPSAPLFSCSEPSTFPPVWVGHQLIWQVANRLGATSPGVPFSAQVGYGGNTANFTVQNVTPISPTLSEWVIVLISTTGWFTAPTGTGITIL